MKLITGLFVAVLTVTMGICSESTEVPSEGNANARNSPLASIDRIGEPIFITLDEDAGNDPYLEKHREELEKLFRVHLRLKGEALAQRNEKDYWQGKIGNIVITSHRYSVPGTNKEFRNIDLRLVACWRSQSSAWPHPVPIFQSREVCWEAATFGEAAVRMLDALLLKYYQAKARGS